MDEPMREFRLQWIGENIFHTLRPIPLTVRLRGKDFMSSDEARKIADAVVDELREHPEKEDEFYKGLVEDMKSQWGEE